MWRCVAEVQACDVALCSASNFSAQACTMALDGPIGDEIEKPSLRIKASGVVGGRAAREIFGRGRGRCLGPRAHARVLVVLSNICMCECGLCCLQCHVDAMLTVR